jgi:predicted DNA-binding transcriptional regulator AlpA
MTSVETILTELSQAMRRELSDMRHELAQIKRVVIHEGIDDQTPFDIRGAADYLGLSKQTLYMMRSNGTGPRELSPRRYIKADLDEWQQTRGIDSAGRARMKSKIKIA